MQTKLYNLAQGACKALSFLFYAVLKFYVLKKLTHKINLLCVDRKLLAVKVGKLLCVGLEIKAQAIGVQSLILISLPSVRLVV